MGRKPNNSKKTTKGKGNESDADGSDVEDVTQEFDYSGLPDLNEHSDSSSDEGSKTESEDEGTSQNRRRTPSKMKQMLNQMEESDDDSDDSEESNTNNDENQIEEIEDIGEEVNASEDGNATSKGSDKKHVKMLTPKKNNRRRKNYKKNDNYIVPMKKNATPDESNDMSGDGTQVNSTKTSAQRPSKKPKSKGNKDDDEDCKEPETPIRSPPIRNPVRAPPDVEDILESSPNENNEPELNEEGDAPMRLEDSGPIGGASAPEHNLLCEAYLNNMRDGVVHEDNQHNRNRNTVTLQLDEKFLSAKKPTMKEANDKKNQLIEDNPQLNTSTHAINTIMAFQFLTWFWTIVTYEIYGCVRMTMLSVANTMLSLIGQQRLNNFDDFQDYLETRNAMLNMQSIWFVLFGHWDSKQEQFKAVERIKILFGIDFQNYEQAGFILVLIKHCLRQIRKRAANIMNAKYGLSLQKSTTNHKIEGKNWSLKRTPGKFKEDFLHWRNGNASKSKYNAFCDKEGIPNSKVKMDKVDTTNKVSPNWEMFSFGSPSNSSCRLLFQNIDDEDNTRDLHTVAKTENKTTSSSSTSSNKRKRSSTPKSRPQQQSAPIEKQSIRREDSDEELPKKKKAKKSNKKKGPEKISPCPHIKDHKNHDMNGLSEETDVRNLSKGYLFGAKCGVCKKKLVNKPNLSEEESKNETIFNSKLTCFPCENFKSTKNIRCSFCMCRDCYVRINAKDSYAATSRRSSRRNRN